MTKESKKIVEEPKDKRFPWRTVKEMKEIYKNGDPDR